MTEFYFHTSENLINKLYLCYMIRRYLFILFGLMNFGYNFK